MQGYEFSNDFRSVGYDHGRIVDFGAFQSCTATWIIWRKLKVATPFRPLGKWLELRAGLFIQNQPAATF